MVNGVKNNLFHQTQNILKVKFTSVVVIGC